jgi:hypothetical protein
MTTKTTSTLTAGTLTAGTLTAGTLTAGTLTAGTLRAGAYGLLSAALALLLLVGVAPAADASSDVDRFAQSVEFARANWTTIDTDVFEDLTIDVVNLAQTADEPGIHRYEPRVKTFYDRWTWDTDTNTRTEVTYVAFDDLPSSAFDVERSLRGATLRFLTVLRDGTICHYRYRGGPPDGLMPGTALDDEEEEDDCSRLPDVPVEVELRWIGEGPTYRDATPFRDLYPSLYHYVGHQVSAIREASVEGGVTALGEAPGELLLPDRPADVGVLLRGKQRHQVVLPS